MPDDASGIRTLPKLDSLLSLHRGGKRKIEDTIHSCADKARNNAHAAWITVLTDEQLSGYIDAIDPDAKHDLPLLGIPFAIKDNIDLAGIPTTAGCPDYAYVPEHHAFVVERLIAAGAIPIGKTNLDQFATGLVGVRSPYGAVRNACVPNLISGGSSSGSAVAVALGEVSFALGTDTAGSGRVPAAFNNIYGHKPSRGWLSIRGVVPACRSLDSVSIFTRDANEAARVLAVAGGRDLHDPYSRPLPSAPPASPRPNRFDFGLPSLEGDARILDPEYERIFRETVDRVKASGGTPREIDLQPFLEAARLLYEGPWLAERLVVTGELLRERPEAIHPVTRDILLKGESRSAVEVFRAQHRLAELVLQTQEVLKDVEFLLLPTTPAIYSLEDLERDPVGPNTCLGRYTNFVNLLDLAAAAVPAGFRRDGAPFGVTLVAPAGHDARLLARAERLQLLCVANAGVDLEFARSLPPSLDMLGGPWTDLVVCGAHLNGEPLNHQLRERGGVLVEQTTTAAGYRLYLLEGGPPMRPALVRDGGSARIEIEVWRIPTVSIGSFLEGIAPPLGLGSVETRSGAKRLGFICEHGGVQTAEDITEYGGWRRWQRTRSSNSML